MCVNVNDRQFGFRKKLSCKFCIT